MALVPKFPDIYSKSVQLFDEINANRIKKNKNSQIFPLCTQHVNQKIRYPVNEPLKKPYVNLKQLEWLIDIDRRSNETTTNDPEEAHRLFMANYRKMFLRDEEIAAEPTKFANTMKRLVFFLFCGSFY